MNKNDDEEKENMKMSDDESSEDDDEEEDKDHTMGDDRANETSKPTVVQEEYKYKVKFENKTLGLDVAKGNNKLWVSKVNNEKLKKKIQINNIIIRVNNERVGNDLSILQSPN